MAEILEAAVPHRRSPALEDTLDSSQNASSRGGVAEFYLLYPFDLCLQLGE